MDHTKKAKTHSPKPSAPKQDRSRFPGENSNSDLPVLPDTEDELDEEQEESEGGIVRDEDAEERAAEDAAG